MRYVAGFLLFLQSLAAQSFTIYTEHNPPWNYIQNGEVKGISVEIFRKIQKEVNNNDPIWLVPWNRGYNETLNKPNHILFSTARITERENIFQWVGPIAVDKVYLYEHLKNPQNVTTLEDAKKVKKIDAGPQNNAAFMILKDKGFENLSLLSRDIGDINHLMTKKTSLLALGENTLKYKVLLEGVKEKDFKNTSILVYEYPLYIAFSKDIDKKTIQKWQQSLDRLKKEGIIDKLIKDELLRLDKK